MRSPRTVGHAPPHRATSCPSASTVSGGRSAARPGAVERARGLGRHRRARRRPRRAARAWPGSGAAHARPTRNEVLRRLVDVGPSRRAGGAGRAAAHPARAARRVARRRAARRPTAFEDARRCGVDDDPRRPQPARTRAGRRQPRPRRRLPGVHRAAAGGGRRPRSPSIRGRSTRTPAVDADRAVRGAGHAARRRPRRRACRPPTSTWSATSSSSAHPAVSPPCARSRRGPSATTATGPPPAARPQRCDAGGSIGGSCGCHRTKSAART